MSEMNNYVVWLLTTKDQKSVVGSPEYQCKIFMYQFSRSIKITFLM